MSSHHHSPNVKLLVYHKTYKSGRRFRFIYFFYECCRQQNVMGKTYTFLKKMVQGQTVSEKPCPMKKVKRPSASVRAVFHDHFIRLQESLSPWKQREKTGSSRLLHSIVHMYKVFLSFIIR